MFILHSIFILSQNVIQFGGRDSVLLPPVRGVFRVAFSMFKIGFDLGESGKISCFCVKMRLHFYGKY